MLACALSPASFASEPQKLLFKSKLFKKINLTCYPANEFRKFEDKVVFTLVLLCSLCCFLIHYWVGIIVRKTWHQYLFTKPTIQIFMESFRLVPNGNGLT